MAVTSERPAPYAPTSAVLDVINRYRNRGLATPIDAGVLARAGVSQSLVARTLYALETLDLITEDGRPTEVFEGIRLAPENEFKTRLEQWLRAAYADAFNFVDPATDDETRIRDAFRGYQPIGQQSRMVSLFIGLCSAAGLAPEKVPRSSTPPAEATPRQRTAVRRIVTQRFADAARHSPRGPAAGLPAPLAGLLHSLPAEGDGWTKADRDKFVTTFSTVLDFCFPVVTDAPPTNNEDGGR